VNDNFYEVCLSWLALSAIDPSQCVLEAGVVAVWHARAIGLTVQAVKAVVVPKHMRLTSQCR
jgi:hypothetical protein